MISLAGSGFKMEEDYLKTKIVTVLFVMMPAHYLYVEMCNLIHIYLRYTPQGANTKNLRSIPKGRQTLTNRNQTSM